MAIFVAQLNCPHCDTKKAAFRGNAFSPAREGHLRIPLSCTHCTEVVVAMVDPQGQDPMRFAHDRIFNLNEGEYFFMYSSYPEAMRDEAPASVPDKIHATFLKALDNRSRGHFDVAVMLCGKVLDLATKDMDQTWSLEKRLKKLANEGKLAPQMADWAEEMRLDRNVAAHHDDDFTAEEAGQIIEFCRAFLTYVYTLPAMIEQRRNAREG